MIEATELAALERLGLLLRARARYVRTFPTAEDHHTKVPAALEEAANALPRLIEAVRALQAFKAFVHRRLDEAEIPTHPDGPHSKEGCRIGDRLDIALASRELKEAKTRAEFAEAGIPGLIFSQRKALVERCAQVVEEYARKAGEDRAYMLKGPALWLRDIATAVRKRGMGPATDG